MDVRLSAPVGGSLAIDGPSWFRQHLSLRLGTQLLPGLFFDVLGHCSDGNQELAPERDGYNVTPETKARRIAAHVGLRYQLVSMPESFSLFAYATAGFAYESISTDYSFGEMGGAWAYAKTRSRGLDAEAGIALERELTDGIGLRIGARMLNARYASHKDYFGSEVVRGADKSVGVGVEPSVELRGQF